MDHVLASASHSPPHHHTPTTALASGSVYLCFTKAKFSWLFSSRTYPVLSHALASDTQQVMESDYARQYFSMHCRAFMYIPPCPGGTNDDMAEGSTLLASPRTKSSTTNRCSKKFKVIVGGHEWEKLAATCVHNQSMSSLPTMGLSTPKAPSPLSFPLILPMLSVSPPTHPASRISLPKLFQHCHLHTIFTRMTCRRRNETDSTMQRQMQALMFTQPTYLWDSP